MNRAAVRVNARRISSAVTRWGRSNFADYPWRHTENRWLSLVAELMLQRTRAASVVSVWEEFSSRYPTPAACASAPPGEPEAFIERLGLVWRAPLLRNLAQALSEPAIPPDDPVALQALPGIGDYAASAYRSLHAGRRAVIVDANVVRWICRMTGDSWDGETRRKRWLRELAAEITPRTTFRDYNYGVLDLTMTLCVRSPRCGICPVLRFCRTGISNQAGTGYGGFKR
jgi:A/G-specific adenine glycosylase